MKDKNIQKVAFLTCPNLEVERKFSSLKTGEVKDIRTLKVA